jgi:2-polyprenyl-6-methoxyphenol hydroxylase-like FAD-dependent oxidoreductase
LFINNATGEVKWRIPPNRRWRVNRESLRRVLLKGVEEGIVWGRRVEGVRFGDDGKPRLILRRTLNDPNGSDEREEIEEEESAPATLIVGTEGSRSSIRRFLCPDNYTNNPLPVRFTGVGISLSAAEVAPLREMDPLLFQGCHPETGDYFWFSMLDTPSQSPPSKPPASGQADTDLEKEGEEKEERPYKVQLGLSWPVRSANDEVARTDAERLANMKRRAANFVPFLRDVFQNIPEETPVVEVKLADWTPQSWDNRNGTVTLVGDAAHAMTMCMSFSYFFCVLRVQHSYVGS